MFEKLCSFFKKCCVASQEVAPAALAQEPLPTQSVQETEKKSLKKVQKPKTATKKVVEKKKAPAQKKTAVKSTVAKRKPKNKK